MAEGTHPRPADVGTPPDGAPAGSSWRRLGVLIPGARARRRQIAKHGEAWDAANKAALGADGPLWLVLGDSTAQAIGASSIDSGYVGRVRAFLEVRDSRPWRVLNLSKSGALAADVVADQLPRLVELAPQLVSCAVGANDLLRRSGDLDRSLGEIAVALPAGSLLANIPRGLREGEAKRVNDRIAELVVAHDLKVVDLWSATGPPWKGKYAADWFHPNDVGYGYWVRAFEDALRTA